jgi:hypothetical protein
VNHNTLGAVSAAAGEPAPTGSPSFADNGLPVDLTITGVRQSSSQLSMIAASASEIVSIDQDTALATDAVSRAGPSWSTATALSSSEQLLLESLQEHDPSLTTAAQRAVSFPRPIAINPNTQAKGFINDFGNSDKPARPKVRGRFSATRRREVQEVRKRGACIRCRMLKKPVSSPSHFP